MLTEDDAIVPSVNKPSAAATNEKETNQSEACGLNCHVMSITKIDCCEFHISVMLTCVKNVLPAWNMLSMYRTKELVAKTTVHYTRVNFVS